MIIKRQKSYSKAGELKKAERAAKKRLKEEWIRKTYPGSNLRSSRSSMQISGWHTGAGGDRGMAEAYRAGEHPTLSSILNKAQRDVAGNSGEGAHDSFDRVAAIRLTKDREFGYPISFARRRRLDEKIIAENKEIMRQARVQNDYEHAWTDGKMKKYFKKK